MNFLIIFYTRKFKNKARDDFSFLLSYFFLFELFIKKVKNSSRHTTHTTPHQHTQHHLTQPNHPHPTLPRHPTPQNNTPEQEPTQRSREEGKNKKRCNGAVDRSTIPHPPGFILLIPHHHHSPLHSLLSLFKTL